MTDSYINYQLLEDVVQAYSARVFDEFGDHSEDEDRHISELERRIIALDEKEAYVTLKTLIETHWETFKKTIKYLKKEGEIL